MSWDVFIMRFPANLADPREIPGDWKPPSIGTNAEVRRVVRGLVPELEVGDDGYARYEGPGFALNVDLSGEDEEETEGITLHFYGGGAAAGLALAITEALGARGIETGGGGFLERGTAQESWEAWQRYRDHVVNQARQQEQP